MYLPQFHQIPENDEWWGEGYTDWMAVKAAKPLYEGHQQPRIPLDYNYYDLLNKNTMMRQADLMHQYGIDGQCFYHYYFQDGRKVLEKPAENLLNWKNIDMPFCFCWDSGRWARTWSNIPGNAWADTFEKKRSKEGEGVLLEQKFCGKQEWFHHFEYLFPFFSDPRYIKVDGLPVFIIHLPEHIYCLKEMMEYWKKLAKQKGLPGIYVIGSNIKYKLPGVDAILLHSPHMFWKLKKDDTKQGLSVCDYEETWERVIKTPSSSRCKTYYMGITDYDDTPRKGKKGIVLQNFSIDKFYEYLLKLYKKSISVGNEFLFINAWNEWGEGMYLEPDNKIGYKYLETVKRAQTEAELMNDNYEIRCDTSYGIDTLEMVGEMYEKSKRINRCLGKWITLREEKRTVEKYLLQLGIEKIAVYGIGILGRYLVEELKDGPIEIRYLIDRESTKQIIGYKTVSPYEELKEVDAIIITVVGEFGSVYDAIKDKTDARLMGIEELIYERI